MKVNNLNQSDVVNPPDGFWTVEVEPDDVYDGGVVWRSPDLERPVFTLEEEARKEAARLNAQARRLGGPEVWTHGVPVFSVAKWSLRRHGPVPVYRA